MDVKEVEEKVEKIQALCEARDFEAADTHIRELHEAAFEWLLIPEHVYVVTREARRKKILKLCLSVFKIQRPW